MKDNYLFCAKHSIMNCPYCKLAALQSRLAEAEELLKYVLSPDFYAKNRTKRDEVIKAFLSPTPEAELCLRCGKNRATICLPEGICDPCWEEEYGGPEMVLVRREDLEKAVDFMENTAGVYWIEICNRLKAAMEKKL